jgi:DNA topoisomerase VI subunit B
MGAVLKRETFATSRLLEFFTEKELRMQIGHAPDRWPLALVKELIDNGLDACEASGVAPRVTVRVAADAVEVQDNGPGLPLEVLEASLDYTQRVSTNTYYVSPTRGQLGNALKTVWAAPFVATGGEHGRVEVLAGGQRHTVDVTLDRIAQEPRLRLTSEAEATAAAGTLVRLHWPEIATAY